MNIMVSKSKVKWLQWIKNINIFCEKAVLLLDILGGSIDHTNCVWFFTFWIVKPIIILSSIILYSAVLQRFLFNYKK